MVDYVALCCRISRNKRGRVEGVRNQEKWGRDYPEVAWPGVPIVVFRDNNISAAEDDDREGYETLREAVKRGEVKHLWTVEQSRQAIPRPRLVQLPVDPERARVRHRLASARRHARIVRALDEVLGLHRRGEVDSLAELVDYAATMLDRGVPVREAAGRRWSI